MTPTFEQEHIDQLRPFLPECMVLLKSNGAFPLEAPCRIAAFGHGVRDTVKGGTGSGEVNSRYFVSVQQGLEQAGFTITNKSWPDQFQPYLEHARAEFRRAIKRKARQQQANVIAASMGETLKQPEYDIALDLSADAAIYVLARTSGEGSDRTPDKGDFALTDSEVRDIQALEEAYERFMLVVNAGGPVDLTPVADIGNILVMSQLGVEGGSALADVLLGTSYPSGKLTTTWAAYRDYCAIGDFAELHDTRYREGIFVGYRYFDTAGKRPLFPFGFGLGYTTFAVSGVTTACTGTHVTVSADIANTGGFRGKETLQVYVSCPSGRLPREAKSLAGFVKTHELAPGDTQSVSVEFDIRDLAAYDTEGARYLLEQGAYVILAGTSSANAQPCAAFTLTRDITVRQVRNLFGRPDFPDAEIAGPAPYESAGLPTIEVDPDTFTLETVSYDDPAVGIPELEALPDEALALLNMGGFDPKGGMLSIVGNASQSVAGAAGESTSLLADVGIPSLVMADGPAGLRLSRQYYEDARGIHSVGAALPESIVDLLPAPLRWLISREPHLPRGTQLKEQYTTALPIATAIAQSFNLEFAELCGDIVGSEMQAFGVDLWLAPALNIHRNVLCGRNFEYFSEDPLVSGRFAAALTRGVQRHPGRGVTVKHCAANNQETNRYASNSLVSERALREIYLKGFQICVKEAAPRALMTSYNLVNGVHTSESADLTRALRHEFGFTGVIMTDWIVAPDLLSIGDGYPSPDPAKVAAAGCSLYMPGSKADFKALTGGLRKGTVTRRQLAVNASWLVRAIWEMQAETQLR